MNHAATYCEGKKCNICSRELWLVSITRAIPASELLAAHLRAPCCPFDWCVCIYMMLICISVGPYVLEDSSIILAHDDLDPAKTPSSR